jgi:hypothetical protein
MGVETPHPDYTAYAPTWTDLRNAYAGSGAVKAAGETYLPRPAGMKRAAQYDAYQARAVWYDATARATNGLTGAVFRKLPQHTATDLLAEQLEDVTLTGIPWRMVAERCVRETLLIGRFGLLVDFPDLEQIWGSAEVRPRPYWVGYTAEELINWRTVQWAGKTVLSLVVLRERVDDIPAAWPSDDFFTVETRPQYRVLRLNEVGVYEVSLWTEASRATPMGRASYTRQQAWIPLRLGQPLRFIPFSFFAPFSLEPAIEKSLLEGLVEINYRYYRHSADYEHALHLTALPTPYICSTLLDPQTELLIGSATAWVIPDSTAQVGLLAVPNSLQQFEYAMTQDIKDAAALGARLLESAPVIEETATANENRLRGAESPMQSLVTTCSQGLSQALQMHAWWAGMTDSPEDPRFTITLNTDFTSALMQPTMIKALQDLLLNRAISYETFYWNLERGEIARPLVTVEEEQALLDQAQEAEGLAGPPALAVPLFGNGTGL